MNKAIASLIIIGSASLPIHYLHAAGVQTQLDNLFVEMETFSQPGKFETQRRSAYFGGRYTYKTQIFNENLVQLSLPSARAGCNGIDAFGGSFSFANSEQLEALMRTIAANARGYAFHIALSTICEKCMAHMSKLQEKIQSLNEYLGNSCRLAQGIVNDTASLIPFNLKGQNDESLKTIATGLVNDLFDVKEGVSSPDTAATIMQAGAPDEAEKKRGAVVYKALTKHTASSWFTGGDTELLESIMSMTGSIVVGPLKEGSEGAGETNTVWSLQGGKLTMSDLIFGAVNKKIYDCSQDPFSTPGVNNCIIEGRHVKTIAKIESLKEKLLNVLVHEQNSILNRFRRKEISSAPDERQQNILVGLPQSIGSKIFELGPISPNAAEGLITDFIDAITLEYVYRFVRASFKAVGIALENTESTFKTPTIEMIKKAEKELRREYVALTKQFGFNMKDVESHYAALLQQNRAKQYLSHGASTGGGKKQK
ncbi:MAG: conjugal transfer protein TraH [Cellvibrionaceae bacterium]|nr:conjugal transfer protein TraH [Cellvibrionaceae bacterium]